MEQGTHIQVKTNIKVVRFGGRDLIPSEVRLRHLQQLVEESEDLYPGIDVWFRRKVVPELKSRSLRSALVLYDGAEPVGAAVVRRDKDAKLCSLRIREESQARGLGSLLMSLVVAEIRLNRAEEIHFTIAAHMWEGAIGEFLKRYGFEFKGLAKTQYRRRRKKMLPLFDSDPEFACSAPFSAVWRNVEEKLSEGFENFTLNGSFGDIDILLSIRPKFARQIVKGEKRVELRRRFSEKWRGARAVIYSTYPERSLVGEATVEEIITGAPDEIWEEWKDDLGCTFEEFSEYSSGKTQMYAIRLGAVIAYAVPIPISQLEFHVSGNLPVPQSYVNLKKQSKWQSALKWGSILSANR
ncbi:hypothetical protein ES703_15157 [subsurface metagenome]|nr:GNAT family N-acetyltransferase [bacterium]